MWERSLGLTSCFNCSLQRFGVSAQCWVVFSPVCVSQLVENRARMRGSSLGSKPCVAHGKLSVDHIGHRAAYARTAQPYEMVSSLPTMCPTHVAAIMIACKCAVRRSFSLTIISCKIGSSFFLRTLAEPRTFLRVSFLKRLDVLTKHVFVALPVPDSSNSVL